MVAGSCARGEESHLTASYSHWSRQLIKHLFTGKAIVMEYLLFNRLYPITSSRKRSRTEGLLNPKQSLQSWAMRPGNPNIKIEIIDFTRHWIEFSTY